MKWPAIFSFTLVFALTFSANTFATEKKLKPQEFCPIMGFAINKEVYLDHQGKRIYFCCPKCIEKFKTDPAGYLKKMEEKGFTPVMTPKRQTNCPVKGGEINREVFVDHDGKRVYFCCPGCIQDFKKDPAGYLKKLADQGVTLEKTPKASSLRHSEKGASKGKKQQHQH